MKTGF